MGIPLSASRLSFNDFFYLMAQLESKLHAWKWKYLSFAGRATLLILVLSFIPLYTMSSVYVPLSALNYLEKEFCTFLWGHSFNRKRLHLFSWSKICKPKKYSGLGLYSLRVKQQALHGKLAINLLLHPTSLWAQLVIAKYKFKGTWLAYSKPHKVSPIWHKICKVGTQFQHQLRRMIDSGISIHVYSDPWITNVSLSRLPTYININYDLSSALVANSITAY